MGVVIANVIAIYRKELQSYFGSPLAWAIASIYWLISGFFFLFLLIGPSGILAQVAIREQMGIANPVDVPYQFLQFFSNVMGSLSLFFLPMLSMGLYTEERKQGTLELLATSPVTNWAVATGKLLGVLTFYATITLPFLLFEAIAFSEANPALPMTIPFVSYLGLILLAGSVFSLGMFVSSLTDSTIFSAISTFFLVFFLWIFKDISDGLDGIFGQLLGHLSLLKHYSNFSQGLIDTGSILVFASYIFLGIFLTAQSIEALRFGRS
ncbi:ABC transporter permease subunit [Oscillatoriales cyanobacterium LEGE 11467]|uniref:ABC transporter permease subunit n=1 Tax=Zarconia navalis LEGE 11467 TaxID=1828826 RepID=A0A928VW18_9CYAN|nr:ABC transporter permease [Zarconia navalis]MBE9040338.1 ABC transporter permease subunit [Zarconia navalis LEGE 11467]